MKTYNTKSQFGYIVTAVTVPLTVHSVMEDGSRLLILTVDKPGQYGFVAMSNQVEIDRDDALFTEPLI